MRLDKTRGLRNALLAAAVALLLALTLFLPSATTSAYAAEPYSFEIENFDATYEVHSDRTIDVEERVTIRYTGYASTGFYRDLPVNAGDRVTGLTVSRLSRDGTTEIDEDYSVDIDNDLIIADIGDSTIKTDTTETYVIRYVFSVTKPTNDNALYLNIIGFGSEAAIRSASATINLPEGFESANLYVGDTDEKSNELMTVDGRTITVELSGLAAFEGATLDMYFSEGALTTRFDAIPYIMAIVGCALLAVLAVVKFLVFPDKTLSPVVGFEPPRGMDPVEISKLIDNKVESSDITTLIYYWASKGYLKIDLSDENDPALIKIFNTLPGDAPAHQCEMYNALFSGRDMVKPSQLAGRFYGVIDNVKKLVNEKHRGLYTTASVCASLLFTLAAGLLMALAPIITGMACINPSLFYYPAFLALVPAFIIYGLTETWAYAVHKLKSSTKWLMLAGIALLAALCTAAYTLLLPPALMETAPKIVVCAVAYIMVMCSVTLISRTKQYNETLSEIVGFRNFILNAEKDRLELLLEGDPEFYYKILPYAQVMGVSDIWEEKFEDLTVMPPAWLNDPAGTLVSFAVINSALRAQSAAFTSKMVIKPSAPTSRSYSGGSHRGGSFGGRGGGGHGGGGFRGR